MMDPSIDPRRAISCLGHRSRFSMVERLARGGCCVTELAGEVALSQSCTTRHLQVLERAGLVVGTREGKRVVYRLRRDASELDGLLGWALGIEPPVSNGRNGSRGADAGRSRRRVSGPAEARRAEAAPPEAPLAAAEAEPPASQPAPIAGEMEDWLL